MMSEYQPYHWRLKDEADAKPKAEKDCGICDAPDKGIIDPRCPVHFQDAMDRVARVPEQPVPIAEVDVMNHGGRTAPMPGGQDEWLEMRSLHDVVMTGDKTKIQKAMNDLPEDHPMRPHLQEEIDLIREESRSDEPHHPRGAEEEVFPSDNQ